MNKFWGILSPAETVKSNPRTDGLRYCNENLALN